MLRDLAQGINRLSTLERSLSGISPKTLTEETQELRGGRNITRKAFPEVPPRVEYTLTAMGRDLIPLVDHMRSYGEKWLTGKSRGS